MNQPFMSGHVKIYNFMTSLLESNFNISYKRIAVLYCLIHIRLFANKAFVLPNACLEKAMLQRQRVCWRLLENWLRHLFLCNAQNNKKEKIISKRGDFRLIIIEM